jgi:polysaccharide transporter, PST family
MSVSFDNPELSATPSPLPTDTLADSVVILLALTVVQRLVGFVRAVLFCRWLDAEQLGLWDMAFSFLLLAAPVAVLAIPGSFGRYLEYYRQRGQLGRFLRWSALACIGLGLASSVGIVSMRHWLSMLVFGAEDHSDLVALAAGCLGATIVYSFLIELFTGLRNIRLVSVMQLANSVAFAVLGVVLLWGWQCSAKSVLAAYGGSCLVAAVLAGLVVRRTFRLRGRSAERVEFAGAESRKAIWPKIVPFAAWILLGSVLTNLFGVVDRYMIVHFSKVPAAEALDVVGNYYSSRVVPTLLVSLAMMLGGMMLPHLSHDWEAGRREQATARLRLFLKLFGFAVSAAAVAVLLTAPLLFNVAFRGKFPGGEAVLPWTLAYCAWFGLATVMQNYLLCAEKAWLSSVALVCGLALSIPMNIVLLPRLGLEGAVLSTTAANLLVLSLVCLFNHRLGFHPDTGVCVVLVLPALLCLNVWLAALSLVVVAVAAIWSNRLLSPKEKYRLSAAIAQYIKRMGRALRRAAVQK